MDEEGDIDGLSGVELDGNDQLDLDLESEHNDNNLESDLLFDSEDRAGSVQRSYRLWNSGKTMEFLKKIPIYGKAIDFGGKNACFRKKSGGNTSGLRNVVIMFVASVITSLGLALRPPWL